ncbi:27044_t:CDS:2, partial [Racocetra persica]
MKNSNTKLTEAGIYKASQCSWYKILVDESTRGENIDEENIALELLKVRTNRKKQSAGLVQD